MLIKYDLYGSGKAGVTSHPQTDFQERGIQVLPRTYIGFPIGDFVVFQIENHTNLTLLPSYAEILDSSDGIVERYYQILETEGAR